MSIVTPLAAGDVSTQPVKTLTLIRGLPGSGKSTLAKAMCAHNQAKHCEADQYFVKHGMYQFDANLLPTAHNDCLDRAANWIKLGFDVVVSNTFTRRWEMQPYINVAESNGYRVNIIVATGDYGNVHGVPDAAIESMRQRWED